MIEVRYIRVLTIKNSLISVTIGMPIKFSPMIVGVKGYSIEYTISVVEDFILGGFRLLALDQTQSPKALNYLLRRYGLQLLSRCHSSFLILSTTANFQLEENTKLLISTYSSILSHIADLTSAFP